MSATTLRSCLSFGGGVRVPPSGLAKPFISSGAFNLCIWSSQIFWGQCPANGGGEQNMTSEVRYHCPHSSNAVFQTNSLPYSLHLRTSISTHRCAYSLLTAPANSSRAPPKEQRRAGASSGTCNSATGARIAFTNPGHDPASGRFGPLSSSYETPIQGPEVRLRLFSGLCGQLPLQRRSEPDPGCHFLTDP